MKDILGVNLPEPRRWLRRVTHSVLAFLGVSASFATAATIVVNDTSDTLHGQCATTGTGVCSLRDAITFANANPGLDAIHFGFPAGRHVIQPLSPLPEVTDAAFILGETQPGDGSAIVYIELDGSMAGAAADGLRILAGPSAIAGISIYGFSGNAIVLSGSGQSQVFTTLLGVDGNAQLVHRNIGAAVLISGSSKNQIGVPDTLRNVVEGNGDGVRIEGAGADGNVVLGTYIGIDFSSASTINPIGNFGDGISVLSGKGNVIEENSVAASGDNGIRIGPGADGTVLFGNFIGGYFPTSGSGQCGILLDGSVNGQIGGTNGLSASNIVLRSGSDGIRLVNGANGNLLQGNLIGTVEFDAPEGNVGAGISVIDSSNNMIGGQTLGAGNIIRYNSGPGVSVAGNAQHNTISANSIFANSIGIDLNADGVTPNDHCDIDSGPNGLQNFPVLTSAVSGENAITIQGNIDSSPNTTYLVEFFGNLACSTAVQGSSFLGSASVATDGSCLGSFSVTLPLIGVGATAVTATATDPLGNTSEFSACLPVAMQYYAVTPCRAGDTRSDNAFNRQPIPANSFRPFQLRGVCGIPSTAQAVALNLTVTQPTAAGEIHMIPNFNSYNPMSTLSYPTGQTRATNAVLELDQAGRVIAWVTQPTGSVHLIVDVNGYFQ